MFNVLLNLFTGNNAVENEKCGKKTLFMRFNEIVYVYLYFFLVLQKRTLRILSTIVNVFLFKSAKNKVVKPGE